MRQKEAAEAYQSRESSVQKGARTTCSPKSACISGSSSQTTDPSSEAKGGVSDATCSERSRGRQRWKRRKRQPG